MVARINHLVAAAITSPTVRKMLAAQLMEPIPGTPERFRARIVADIARWKPVITAAKISIH
jgi:tripartite-type tricarboxylate transporter receptor subunit TctC